MRRILFLLAIALVSLFSFYGCDNENNLFNNEDNKTATDSENINITLNRDSLSLYVGVSDTLIAIVRDGDKIVDCKVSWSIDNTSIAEVAPNGVVTALSVGTAVITIKYKDVTYTCKVVVTECPKTYEYVDLGLSVLWASYNVGATKPEELGDYYAWGESETKTSYSWETYDWCNESENELTKYCTISSCGYNGFTDTKTTLDPEDDVAHVMWGGNWRMPTMEELLELCNNCTWSYYDSGNTEFNGVVGFKVTSNKKGYTDRFIFLPVAGQYFDNGLSYVGYYSVYWSCSLESYGPDGAWGIYLSDRVVPNIYKRYVGQSVRPVCPKNSVESVAVAGADMSLIKGNMHSLKILANGVIHNGSNWTSDNESIATVNSEGVVRALSIGTTTITASYLDRPVSCTITVVDESEVEHDFVDLGLSVKWASFNVGATRPEQGGSYYAWGETEPKTVFDWSTYKWCKGSYSSMTKYCSDSSFGNDGFTDTQNILDLEDDVAHVKWGGTWRMPTIEEQDELFRNCTIERYCSGNTEFNGVAGYKLSSRIEGYEDNFIFLPAAGYCIGTYIDDVGYYGKYWSSSLNTFSSRSAYCIDCALTVSFGSDYRLYGFSVRPVCP